MGRQASMLTWSSMRGDANRTWYRLSDLLDASQASGRRWTPYQVRRAIKHLPTPKVRRYWHLHYEQQHMDALMAAVRAEVAGE